MFYGGRNNKHLILSYGFAYKDNAHDSFEISLRLDRNPFETFGNKSILAKSN